MWGPLLLVLFITPANFCEEALASVKDLNDHSIFNGCILQYDSDPWPNEEPFLWPIPFLNVLRSPKKKKKNPSVECQLNTILQ